MAQRVLVIGLDGATLDLLGPWAQAGQLPNLAEFTRVGAAGDLLSTIPPVSPAAWSTFMTGKNPGKHGVFDFMRRDFNTYGMQVTQRPSAATLWGILSAQGREVCVINVPQTYPPEEVNGVMVTGLGTPAGRTFTSPSELSEKLLSRGFRFSTPYSVRRDGPDAFIDGVFAVAEVVADAAIDLLTQRSWDLGMVVLRLTDEIPHYFWHHMDATHPRFSGADSAYRETILNCYKKADALVGRLIETVVDPSTAVIIVSDHGFGPLHRDVHLNEWLRKRGFLSLRCEPGQQKGVQSLLRRLGLTQAQLGPLLGRVGLNGLRAFFRDRTGTLTRVLPADPHVHLADVVDWKRTLAYSAGYIGQIYVNVTGRDPEGIVAPGEEYEMVCDRLVRELLDWTHPCDGTKIVDEVYRRNQLYWGAYAPLAPDLLLTMRGLKFITRQNREIAPRGEIFTDPPTGETGGHRMEGLLLAKGADIAHAAVEDARIRDMAPTILHLLGCAVPTDMDGRVLERIMTTEFLAGHAVEYAEPGLPVKPEAELSQKEEADIVERLRDLGYLG